MNRARHDSSSDKERRELYFRANVLQRTFVDIRRGERIKKKKKKKNRKGYAKQSYFRKLLSKTNFSQNINSIGNVYARSGGVSVVEGKIGEFSWFRSEFGAGNACEPSKIQ